MPEQDNTQKVDFEPTKANWDFQPPPEHHTKEEEILRTVLAGAILAGLAANPSASPDVTKAVRLTDQLLAELAKPSK